MAGTSSKAFHFLLSRESTSTFASAATTVTFPFDPAVSSCMPTLRPGPGAASPPLSCGRGRAGSSMGVGGVLSGRLGGADLRRSLPGPFTAAGWTSSFGCMTRFE